jgi:hydrogenase-4 component B
LGEPFHFQRDSPRPLALTPPPPGVWLTGLAVVVAGLFLLGIATLASGRARLAYWGSMAGCALGAICAIGFLVAGASPAALPVPIGLPGAGILLGLDGLSAYFLLLLTVAGIAASAAALDDHGAYDATAPLFPAFIGAMAMTLLAADTFSLVLAFEAMSLASFGLVLTNHTETPVRSAALLYLGMAAVGGACLIPAMALLAHLEPWGIDLSFSAIRAHPPEGWRAVLVLALVLVGAGSKAGLAPLHVWLPPAHAAAPAHVSALMSGAMTKVALYVIVRMLFDLCGPAQPAWWGVPLMLAGAAGAVLGALRANIEGDIKAALACSTVENVGLIAVGLGLALAARAADLSALASLAMGAALLHAMAHGLFKSLLFLGAGAAQHGAGTRRLDRLGGLIQRMPVTTACMLVGAASLAALPPTSGFAGEWTLFQAILGGPRIGGVALQTLICVVALLMGLAAALAAAAAVRLIGVGFLGRPRTPRAAAAQEVGPPAQFAMLGLAALSLLIGLFPGAVLTAAEPALRLAVKGSMHDRLGVFTVSPQADGLGYAAPAVAVLLALTLGGVVWLVRRRGVGGHRRGPAWDCGFGAPPAWLPFGDPITQYGGASFGQPLRRALGAAILGSREMVDMPDPGQTRAARFVARSKDPATAWLFQPLARGRGMLSGAADRTQFLTIRRTLSLIFSVLVFFLIVVVLVEQL